jgi:aspartate/methionine/tyrosine aminotransferase
MNDMKYVRMPIEIEAPEELGYDNLECNLTESSMPDFHFRDLGLRLDELVLSYVDHRGHEGLRSLLSAETSGLIPPENVLITSGAAQALFIISTSTLSKGDGLLVVRPNYATNIETPRAIGADIRFLDLRFEDGYRLDPDRIRSAITPSTRLVSITVPHNPTGVCTSREEIAEIVQITSDAGCLLLVDETYRDMNRGGVMPYAATLGDHVISVASFSKTYGLPGIRIGWLMTRNAKLFETFFAAKEQIQICGSALDEEIAFQFTSRKQEFLPKILKDLDRRFGLMKGWMERQEHLEWVEPTGGCVAFPRFRESVWKTLDVERFYELLNRKYKTYVGPGHWFEQERRYMRVGYGWPEDQELLLGLDRIGQAIRELCHDGHSIDCSKPPIR